MIFGMPLFLFVHVALSLIGIATGLLVLLGLLNGNRMNTLTAVFLATTLATSLTGFGFPFQGFTPALGVGILSCIVLAAAIAARYTFRLAGLWRAVYVVAAMVALYFNVFVLVVQAFQKLPALHALAPNGNEPPFAVAQGVVLVFFVVASVFALKRFHPAATSSAA